MHGFLLEVAFCLVFVFWRRCFYTFFPFLCRLGFRPGLIVGKRVSINIIDLAQTFTISRSFGYVLWPPSRQSIDQSMELSIKQALSQWNSQSSKHSVTQAISWLGSQAGLSFIELWLRFSCCGCLLLVLLLSPSSSLLPINSRCHSRCLGVVIAVAKPLSHINVCLAVAVAVLALPVAATKTDPTLLRDYCVKEEKTFPA